MVIRWLLVFASIYSIFVECVQWHQQKLYHTPTAMSEADLRYVAGLSDEALFNRTLAPILISRIPSTQGHDKVKRHIISTMNSLQWSVRLDSFMDQTPLGLINFTNVIATLDPKATRHLVLACHYDSKLDREKALVLATDSAVPCAMMMNLAMLLNDSLMKSKELGSDLTLQLIFFDGEEAFERWSDRDSTYGSRHLARSLSSTRFPKGNKEKTTLLHRMDVMVLLDLLGCRDPTFYNFFHDTSNLFQGIASIENQLHNLRLLTNHSRRYFIDQTTYSGVEDDHIPFMNRGVRILHLIPVPFPTVWHTEMDNVDNLDFPTIDNLNKILRAFVYSYLHLGVETSPL